MTTTTTTAGLVVEVVVVAAAVSVANAVVDELIEMMKNEICYCCWSFLKVVLNL